MEDDELPIPLPRLSRQRRTATRRAKRLDPVLVRTLRHLRALCDAVGVKTPRWALDLLGHAEAVSCELPTRVVNALTDPMVTVSAKCESPAARRWGTAMGIWVDCSSGDIGGLPQ